MSPAWASPQPRGTLSTSLGLPPSLGLRYRVDGYPNCYNDLIEAYVPAQYAGIVRDPKGGGPLEPRDPSLMSQACVWVAKRSAIEARVASSKNKIFIFRIEAEQAARRRVGLRPVDEKAM